MTEHGKKTPANALAQNLDTIMLEQVEIASYDHLVKVITGQLMRIFEPVGCTFSKYDPEKRALQVLDIKAGPGVLDLALKMGAFSFLPKPVPVDERVYTQMAQERIITRSTLHEATNGVVPQNLSTAVGKALRISCYLGISFVVDNEIFGTSVLALKAEPDPPLIDRLKTYVAFTSITIKRLLTEQKLRESEARNRAILSAFPDLMFVYDLDGTYLDFHASDRSLLAVEPAYFLNKSVHEVLPKVVADRFMHGLKEANQSGKTQKIEYSLEALAGRKHFEARINPLEQDKYIAIVRDITDRRQAEEALKISEQKHREILAAMEEGYYEVDLAGNFVFFNESYCRMLGCNSEELMGESYKRFYKDTKKVFETYNQVYKTGKPVKAIDWPAITWDGSEAYWELSVSLRCDEKGEPIGFRGVVRDITARRQAEEKVRYLSYHDQLTGLYNRHFLEEEMNRLDTERQLPISIIMADLNGLKLVNDTIGHLSGDDMLKRAAAILKSVCREDDLLARFGGDEFVLYLPRTPEKEALSISDRIIQSCRGELISNVPLSLSTGLAVKTSAEQKLTDVLRRAEDSMYRDKLTESRSGKSTIVNSLLQTLAAKSFETEAHTHNMQEAAKSIGVKLGLPHSELHRLQLLITLHDIGKISIPEELLTRKGPLSGPEWEIIKKHCETGYRVARATASFAHVAEDILAHHERWDGSGYPQGLKGDQIPLLARITAIADAYEVMYNGRPYKKAMSKSEITAEFKNCAGTQFDPQLVELFLAVL